MFACVFNYINRLNLYSFVSLGHLRETGKRTARGQPKCRGAEAQLSRAHRAEAHSAQDASVFRRGMLVVCYVVSPECVLPFQSSSVFIKL